MSSTSGRAPDPPSWSTWPGSSRSRRGLTEQPTSLSTPGVSLDTMIQENQHNCALLFLFYKMLDSKLYDLFAEAHPTESGDYIDYQYPVNDHKSLEDRLEAASKCQDCLIEQRRPHLHFRPAAEPGDAARAPAAGQHDGRGLQVLYCTVVCCTVLYCTLLYCTVLYCTELIL